MAENTDNQQVKLGLEFEEKQPERKKHSTPCSLFSDIDASQWRDHDDIELGTLWLFGSRDKGNGHSLDYHGNYIPQIATQLLSRFTKAGDVVLDMFLGSGTTAIEALNMERRCVGVEIQPRMVEHVRSKFSSSQLDRDVHIVLGDSTDEKTGQAVRETLSELDQTHAQFLMLHPPYWDIIKFSEDSSDLSNAGGVDDFLSQFRQVAEIGFDLLEPGRFAALVIGDKYAAGELVPLGFLTMQQMTEAGYKLKSIVVKNIEGNEVAKGRTNNLWRYRALAGGFYIFKHEYVMLFQKPKTRAKIRMPQLKADS